MVPDGLGVMNIEPSVLGNCAAQLHEKGLIQFRQIMGHSYRAGYSSITAFGVDIVEGNARSPIAVSIDSSINISASHGVQIGGQGNSQNLTFNVEKMISIVDATEASIVEKEEAKSLLKRLADNKLVQLALRTISNKWFES